MKIKEWTRSDLKEERTEACDSSLKGGDQIVKIKDLTPQTHPFHEHGGNTGQSSLCKGAAGELVMAYKEGRPLRENGFQLIQ